jgi:mersacidin/lichenicidin family type 2 lantibiotic
MLREKIIRAWKDLEYRQNLSEEEREHLPANPAGAIELTDEELDMAAGGHPPNPSWRQSQSRSYRPSNSRSYRPSNSQSWSNRPSQSWRPSYRRRPSYSYRGRW